MHMQERPVSHVFWKTEMPFWLPFQQATTTNPNDIVKTRRDFQPLRGRIGDADGHVIEESIYTLLRPPRHLYHLPSSCIPSSSIVLQVSSIKMFSSHDNLYERYEPNRSLAICCLVFFIVMALCHYSCRRQIGHSFGCSMYQGGLCLSHLLRSSQD